MFLLKKLISTELTQFLMLMAKSTHGNSKKYIKTRGNVNCMVHSNNYFFIKKKTINSYHKNATWPDLKAPVIFNCVVIDGEKLFIIYLELLSTYNGAKNN